MDRSRLRYGLLGLGTLAYAGLMLVWFSVAAYLAGENFSTVVRNA